MAGAKTGYPVHSANPGAYQIHGRLRVNSSDPVNGDPQVIEGGRFVATKQGVGQYRIELDKVYAGVLSAFAQANQASTSYPLRCWCTNFLNTTLSGPQDGSINRFDIFFQDTSTNTGTDPGVNEDFCFAVTLRSTSQRL